MLSVYTRLQWFTFYTITTVRLTLANLAVLCHADTSETTEPTFLLEVFVKRCRDRRGGSCQTFVCISIGSNKRPSSSIRLAAELHI